MARQPATGNVRADPVARGRTADATVNARVRRVAAAVLVPKWGVEMDRRAGVDRDDAATTIARPILTARTETARTVTDRIVTAPTVTGPAIVGRVAPVALDVMAAKVRGDRALRGDPVHGPAGNSTGLAPDAHSLADPPWAVRRAAVGPAIAPRCRHCVLKSSNCARRSRP